MSFPSSSNPHEPPNLSSPNSTARNSNARAPTQSAWGLPGHSQSGPRRGLTPLATTQAAAQARTSTSSPSRHVLSPISSAAFNPPPSGSRQISSRHSSTSSSSSLFAPLAPVGQQGAQNRSRTVTASGSPRLGSSATGGFGIQERAGSGGGSSIGSSRLVRQSPSLSVSTGGSPTSSNPQSAGSSGQITSLVVTQLNILLSTIKEDKDRSKWEAQADKIWKLVEAHGMDVFIQFFRRLLTTNASQIFGTPGRSGDGFGTYQLLVTELQKLAAEVEQARKIAEALDTTDGDLFRDFDLAAFVDHFRLPPVSRIALVLACRNANKPDLKVKSELILASSIDDFFNTVANPTEAHDNLPATLLAWIINGLATNPPRAWTDERKAQLPLAARLRYSRLGASMPYAVGSALALLELNANPNAIIRLIQQSAIRPIQDVESWKDLLAKVDANAMSYHHVADALLYLALSESDAQRHNITSFVTALRQHRSGQRLDWRDVVSAFDRPDLRVTKPQFLSLFNALLPIPADVDSFDMQTLWGGGWHHPETQLSFVVALLSTTQAEIDVAQLTKLRAAFRLEEFAEASDEVKEHAAKALTHPMVSYDATEALFTIIFSSQEAYNNAQSLGIPEAVINANTDVFVCAASAVVKPWSPLQEQALKQLFYPFFTKALPNHSFVMHALWIHDKTWLAGRLIEHYNNNPKILMLVLEHAKEHNWIDTLTGVRNDFGLDFTALAHSQSLVNLEDWAHSHTEGNKVPAMELSRAIIGFLRFKIDDELVQQRDPGQQSATVPLQVKTVYTLLNTIQGTVTEQEDGAIQRACIQAYPRLINYGYKFDAIIDSNGENGNALSTAADARMQEQYKDMYSGDADARKMISTLRTLRDSDDAGDQELFACMIHGLFDEYNCFGEYPLEALATTAVLFGGIINYGILHSRITLSVALFMVVDALACHTPEDSMYKFGLQASLHFIGRLEEWPQLCERLCRIPGLRGTEVFNKAEEIVRGQAGAEQEEVLKETGLSNGNSDEADAEPGYQPFASINSDAPLRSGFYEDPDEETSDKVTFVLNNVSKRNIEEKFKELEIHLDERFHQWFAQYLVENLAKSQPNFQGLYLQLLDLFDRKLLWAEVIRETYVSIARIINAESTATSTADRTNLKNLAIWLGLLTLARNKPILHRNISFKDLLIEAHQTQRLNIALPFACKALQQTALSTVFRPPNPWLMELLGLLMELYHFAELKLNFKFEIEVLCKELGLDHKTLEPADIIRSLPLTAEEPFLQPYAPDSIDGFGDMLGLSKRSNDRLSAQDVMKSLPDLATVLQFPPAPGNVGQQQFKNVFLTATSRAIQEIIAPVVDRSVTIAAISTAQIVEKDFATETDVEKMQKSAHTVVKALSGSLALVTCKEPLRMSIQNNIRLLAAQHFPDQLPEGSILMFTNDNLDKVCKLVEDSAESYSMAEIDGQLETALEARRQHRQQRPHEPFNNPQVSRWAFVVPEPYRIEQSGLNAQQLAIYDDFGRHVRAGPSSHSNTMSQDNSRQISDVLGEGYLQGIPTPAETPALPRQALQQQTRIPPPTQGAHSQSNGFIADPATMLERLASFLDQLLAAARDTPEDHIKDLPVDSPIRELYGKVLQILDSAGVHKDQLALNAGQRAAIVLYSSPKTRLESEILAQFLRELCTFSPPTARQLTLYLTTVEDDRAFSVNISVALLKAGLIHLSHVDALTAKALDQRRSMALAFFDDLVDELLEVDQPGLLRAEFMLSFTALGKWLAAEEADSKAQEIFSKLNRTSKITNGVSAEESNEIKQDALEHAFEEWVALQRLDVPFEALATFIEQLYARDVISDNLEYASLMRVACDLSVAGFENELLTSGNFDRAYVHVDAWAKLIAILVICYQEDEVIEKPSKRLAYLEQLLCSVVLLLNHQYVKQVERFNAKVFFRLFSSLFVELHDLRDKFGEVLSARVPTLLAKALLVIQPQLFPGFAYHWVALVGHRMLIVPLMQASMKQLQRHSSHDEGWDAYVKLLSAALSYLGDLKDLLETSPAVQDLYRALLRVLCAIQHDHPEFLAENHLYLNSSIADKLVQLQNVVNCSNPGPGQDLPDPFTPGLKINRLDQVRNSPTISADIDAILNKAGINALVERAIGGVELEVADLAIALDKPMPIIRETVGNVAAQRKLVLNALIVSIGSSATVASSTFSASAPQAKLVEALLSRASPATRYGLLSAMANQIRFPSSHTHYFSTAVLHLLTVSSEEVQQQIVRVLVERLLVARPHPWGLIVTVVELIKNTGRYNVFEQRWMKAAPEVERLLLNIAHSSQVSVPASSPR